MNYQEIPFLVCTHNQDVGQSISQLLGRKANTQIKELKEQSIHEFFYDINLFSCIILHLVSDLSNIENIVKTTLRKNPLTVVIVFSFLDIPAEIYQNLIRCGASDILIPEEDEDEDMRDKLLKTLNHKWRAYRYIEREKKKIFQATVVTAYHEINQPLTVISNALGLLKMEFKAQTLNLEQLEKFIMFIKKGTDRIQEVLDQLKKIESPEYKDYTKGVPMITLDSSLKEGKKEIKESEGKSDKAISKK
jgi:signal transduction histidine kinase